MDESGKKIWKTGIGLTLSAILVVLAIGFYLRPKADLTPAEPSNLPWLTDYPKALVRAQAENKFVFLSFGGSDWCPGCILLDKKVFPTKEFADFAQSNLILVDIDLPLKKPQSEDLRQANMKLAEQFNADALPCLILLNKDGKEIFRRIGFDAEKDSTQSFIGEFQRAIERAKKS